MAGKVGGLTFSDLNTAFKSTDLLRQQQDVQRLGREYVQQARWLGRITGRTDVFPYKYTAVQVERNGDAWTDVPGGFTLDLENGYALNRFEVDGAPSVPDGTVVEMLEAYDVESKPYWEFAAGTGGTTEAYVGTITAVNGTENATYAAEAWSDPSVTAGPNAVPVNRAFPLPVTYAPLEVGDICLLLRIFDDKGAELVYLVAWERVNVTTCEDGIQQPADDPEEPPKAPRTDPTRLMYASQYI